MTAHPGAPESSLHLAATDSALGCAQREVWRVVDAWGLGHVADVVELLALELVDVALDASGQAVARLRYRDLLYVRQLSLRFRLGAEGLVIATWDGDPRPPRFKEPGTGHGDGGELYWVPMLAEAWDFFRSGSGKVVWCECVLPPPSGRRLPRRSRTRPSNGEPRYWSDLATLKRVRMGLDRL